MPLVWAHAEHLKLARSLRDGKVFDLPARTHRRYVVEHVQSPFAVWRHDRRLKTIAHGLNLRIEADAPCLIHWTQDQWNTATDAASRDTGLGRHLVDVMTATCPVGTTISFTFYWSADDRWERVDFSLLIVPQDKR
jgi:glucoamylase